MTQAGPGLGLSLDKIPFNPYFTFKDITAILVEVPRSRGIPGYSVSVRPKRSVDLFWGGGAYIGGGGGVSMDIYIDVYSWRIYGIAA